MIPYEESSSHSHSYENSSEKVSLSEEQPEEATAVDLLLSSSSIRSVFCRSPIYWLTRKKNLQKYKTILTHAATVKELDV